MECGHVSRLLAKYGTKADIFNSVDTIFLRRKKIDVPTFAVAVERLQVVGAFLCRRPHPSWLGLAAFFDNERRLLVLHHIAKEKFVSFIVRTFLDSDGTNL